MVFNVHVDKSYNTEELSNCQLDGSITYFMILNCIHLYNHILHCDNLSTFNFKSSVKLSVSYCSQEV